MLKACETCEMSSGNQKLNSSETGINWSKEEKQENKLKTR